MRTGQIATLLLAAGLLTTGLLAIAPSASACSILVTPTKCVTRIYENERDLLLEKTGNLEGEVSDGIAGFEGTYETARATAESASGDTGTWLFMAPGHASGCASGDVPGVEWSPQGAIDGNLAYAGMQQQALLLFPEEAQENPFPATANLIDRAYDNTIWVFASWDENVFQPLLVATLEDAAAQFQGEFTTPQIAMPGEAFVDETGASLTATIAGTNVTTACLAEMPMPPL